MELKMQEIKSVPVVFNYEELKNELEVSLKGYSNYVVTEENLPVATKDIAKLNKVKKVLNDKRKEVKKLILEDYELFEQQIGQLTGLIDEAIKTLKDQTQTYEDERIESKRNEVIDVFNQYNDINLNIDKIWNERWLNKTFSIKDVEIEIKQQFAKIKSNISMIDKLNYTDEEKHTILVSYLFNLDLDLSIKQFEDGKANYQKMIESQNKPLQAEKQETSTITLDTPQTSVEHAKTSVKVYSSVMRFTDNVENMVKLKKFLDETGITYEIIENMKEVK